MEPPPGVAQGKNVPVEDFDHCNLRAHRPLLEKLRDFYVEIVGLREGPRPPFRSSGYWLYAGPRPVVHLTEAGPDESRPVDGVGTFAHVAFRCTDHERYRMLLDERNIPFVTGDVPVSGELQYFLKDPAGNGVELSFKR